MNNFKKRLGRPKLPKTQSQSISGRSDQWYMSIIYPMLCRRLKLGRSQFQVNPGKKDGETPSQWKQVVHGSAHLSSQVTKGSLKSGRITMQADLGKA
jgi:hypothetical protein